MLKGDSQAFPDHDLIPPKIQCPFYPLILKDCFYDSLYPLAESWKWPNLVTLYMTDESDFFLRPIFSLKSIFQLILKFDSGYGNILNYGNLFW